jgi:hypothetical protein
VVIFPEPSIFKPSESPGLLIGSISSLASFPAASRTVSRISTVEPSKPVSLQSFSISTTSFNTKPMSSTGAV